MGLFDNFPYTNFHELNLDWILNALRILEHTIDDFVAINALKYADPIQWNITSQYEKNTIVIDPQTGTAYISVQPVPAGVSLTNTDYWTVVFDLGSFVVKASKNFTDKYEADTTTTATFNSNIGDWLVWADTLYIAISNITAGDAYVINSNIRPFTMEDIIGHLTDLTTVDQSNIVAAINELVTAISNTNITIGDLNNLITTDKTSIVNAINDEVSARIIALSPFTDSQPINVLTLGVKNDGSEDCSTIINAHTTTEQLYFPTGQYRFDSPIILGKSIYGASNSRVNGYNTRFIANFTNDSLIKIDTSNDSLGNIEIKNIFIDCDSKTGVDGIYSTTNRYVNIENISIMCFGRYGIYFNPTSIQSRPLYMNGVYIDGGLNIGIETTLQGLYIGANANDCKIDNVNVMHCAQNVYCAGGGSRFTNMHLYAGRSNLSDATAYFERSINFECVGNVMADNIYCDSALQGWVQRSGAANIGNIFYYNDDSLTSQYSGANVITVYRSIGNSAPLIINNAIIGGSPNKFGAAFTDEGTVINNLTYLWADDTLFSSISGAPKTTACNGKRHIVGRDQNGNEWIRMLAIRNNAAGLEFINVTGRKAGTKITIDATGSGIGNVTLTAAKLSADYYAPISCAYKADGDTIYIYFQASTALDIFLDVLCPNFTTIDLTNLCNIPIVSQADSSGLTVLI